jgi:hypothetical protein
VGIFAQRPMRQWLALAGRIVAAFDPQTPDGNVGSETATWR